MKLSLKNLPCRHGQGQEREEHRWLRETRARERDGVKERRWLRETGARERDGVTERNRNGERERDGVTIGKSENVKEV